MTVAERVDRYIQILNRLDRLGYSEDVPAKNYVVWKKRGKYSWSVVYIRPSSCELAICRGIYQNPREKQSV